MKILILNILNFWMYQSEIFCEKIAAEEIFIENTCY